MFMMKRFRVLWLFVLPLLAVVTIFAYSSFALAHDTSEKYYESVLVEEGDTLWSLAGEYSDFHYDSYEEYIREVRTINHLCEDSLIHEGCYLVLPYYD